MAVVSESGRKEILDADLPKTRPAYRTFIVDDLERVWVQWTTVEEASSSMWSILNSEGGVVAEAELPANVTLEVVKAGRAYGSVHDEAGPSYLIAYSMSE